MLVQLLVKNFALIEALRLEFAPGLNILTGETGAGKSIIVDTVMLLLGARANVKDIRYGEDKALVEGVFSLANRRDVQTQLQELGLQEDGEDEVVVLSREITLGGKNTCRINHRIVTLQQFKSLSSMLINIYGQHDYQSLLSEQMHIHLLDSLGDETFQQAKEQVHTKYQAAQRAGRELKKALQTRQRLHTEQGEIASKLAELAKIKAQPGEDDTLEKELLRLNHHSDIIAVTAAAYAQLYGQQDSVYNILHEHIAEFERLGAFDERFAPLVQALQEAEILIVENVHELSRFQDGIDADLGRIGVVEGRLKVLDRLKKQYQMSLAEILTQEVAWQKQVDDYENQDALIADLTTAYKVAKQDYQEAALALSDRRKALAKDFEVILLSHLQDLAMAHAKFVVDFGAFSGDANGLDKIQFLLSANPGVPPMPLDQVASGGEMSRIMLAFKTILTQYEGISTIIFDEIDTGIGGNVLLKVAAKIKAVSQQTQVLCVTHAPQIAAVGDRHFHIYKTIAGDATKTQVQHLDEAASVLEIARMLGGEGEIQLAHARKLKQFEA